MGIILRQSSKIFGRDGSLDSFQSKEALNFLKKIIGNQETKVDYLPEQELLGDEFVNDDIKTDIIALIDKKEWQNLFHQQSLQTLQFQSQPPK